MSRCLYVIKTTDTEYTSSYKVYYATLDEARAHIMDYNGWYENKGSCTICKVDNHFRVWKEWIYYNGNLQGVNDYEDLYKGCEELYGHYKENSHNWRE